MYFLTTINKDGESSRCVGYFETLEQAEEIISKNICDIFEYFYDYAVIENIPTGIYKYDCSPKWYKWNLEKNCYEKTEKPEFANGYVGWSIG